MTTGNFVQIKDGTERALPLPRLVSVLFVLRDENLVPIEPDSIDSITIYRIAKSPEYQADPSAYVFLKKTNAEDATKPIWSSDDQGFVSGTVASGEIKIEVDKTQIEDGASHDFSNDILLLDGERVPVSSDRVNVSGTDTLTFTISVGDLVADGTAFEITWNKRPFDQSIRRYGPGTFEYMFDSGELRFGPGSYFSLIEFSKGADTGTGAVEFFFDRELSMAQSNLSFRRERLRDTTKNKIPFFYFDLENFEGSDGNFKTQDLIGYFNEMIAREYDLVEGVSDVWDPLTAPVLVLDHVAAEYGFRLIGLDQKKWRDQVIYATDRLKQKGSVEGLCNRLADCGADLEDFANYYQVRSQKFGSQAWVITPETESELLLDGANARTYRLPLNRPPWYFPYGRERRDPLVPFVTLEIRGEGEDHWHTLPSREGNFLLVRFEERDGKWYALVTLDKIIANTFPPQTAQIVDPYRLTLWDEVRVTYPVAPWGLIPSTLDFEAQQTWPFSVRSGPSVLYHLNDAKFISIGESGGLPSIIVNELTADGPVELEANTRPPARRGYSVIWYAEYKALIFGGINIEGRFLNDTWLLDFSDLGDLRWTLHEGTAPPARAGATVLDTHDATSQSNARSFLFGGVGRSGTFGDTWRWNEASLKWEPVTPNAIITESNFVFGNILAGDFILATAGNIDDTTNIRKGHVILFESGADVRKRFALRVTSVPGGTSVAGVILWVDNDYEDYYATSTTSETIGTGSKTITINTGKSFVAGQEVIISEPGTPANYMRGAVTSYNANTGELVVLVASVGGSGTIANWQVCLFFNVGVINLEPSPRAGAGACSLPVDAGSSNIAHAVMFGGYDQKSGPKNEVWALEYSGRWTQVWPSDQGPTRGYQPTMIRVQSNEPGAPWQLYVRAGTFDGGQYSEEALRSSNSLAYYRLDGLLEATDPEDMNDSAQWVAVDDDIPNFVGARTAARAAVFAEQHLGSRFTFEYSIEAKITSRRPKGTYAFLFDQVGDNRLEVAPTSLLDAFPNTLSDVTRPVAEFGLFETGVEFEDYYTINSDAERMTVSSQKTVVDSWRFAPEVPQQRFVQNPLDPDELYWNISPASMKFNERRIAVPIDNSVPTAGTRKHLVRFKMEKVLSFMPSVEDTEWCPVAQSTKRYKLLMRIYEPSGDLVAYGAIEDVGASAYATSSLSSVSIGTGSKVFSVASGLPYVGGETVKIEVNGDPSSYMEGIVTAYVGSNLTVNVATTSGSGLNDDWNISIVSTPIELIAVSSDIVALNIKVEEDGSSDGVVFFRQYNPLTNSEAMLIVDMRWSDDFTELPPLGGSYAAVDDRWFQLVAATSGETPRLTLTDEDGESFIIDPNDFVFVHDPLSNKSEVWMKSMEAPDLTGIVEVYLRGRYPARFYSLPPGIWEHRAFWRVDPYFPGGLGTHVAVIAFTFGWKDDLLLEPSVYWGDLEKVGEGYRQVETRKRLVDRWKLTMRKPDGTTVDISTDQYTVEKVYHLPGYHTEVRISIDSSVVIPSGSTFSLIYPMGRVVILDSFGITLNIFPDITTEEAKRFGFGDYFRRLTGDSVVEFTVLEDRTDVSLRPASIVSLGRPQDIVPTYILGCQQHIDISSSQLDRQSFYDTVAYDPLVDEDWKVNDRILWTSNELAAVVGSEIDPLTSDTRKIYKKENLDDVPEFSPIYAVTLFVFNGSVPYGGRNLPGRLEYPISTISYSDSLRDLLHISLLQGRVPLDAKAAAGLDDWLELYVLSMPRADVRRIDQLRTYALWKKQLLAGEEPTVVPSPKVDHETRLIDLRDENLKVICGDHQPFPSNVVFGQARTEVPFGRTVFNTDEFDGSVRPSSDPCDIDESFIEPCSCSPASHIGFVVTVPIAGSVTINELKEVITEMLPADAVQRFMGFRSTNQDLVPRPKESVTYWVRKAFRDTVLTFDPRRMPDGTKIPNPLWDAILDGTYAPFYKGDHWIQPDTSKGVEWLLTARQFAKTALPFAGIDYAGVVAEKAFALVMGRTKRLRGVSRFDETALVFREEFNGYPDSRTDFEIFNEITPTLSMTVTEVGRNLHVAITGLETNVIVKGDFLVFAFGPDQANAIDGNAVYETHEVLDVLSGLGGPFFVIDQAGASTLQATIASGTGPKAIAVSTDGQLNRSSLKVLAERQYTNPNASHAGKLSIEPVTQQEGFGAAQPTSNFNLLGRVLRKNLLFTDSDAAKYPELQGTVAHSNLYDPDAIGVLTSDMRIDGIGSIYYGQVRAVDFVIVDGKVRAYRLDNFQTNLVLATIVDDQEIVFDFVSPQDLMTLRNFTYVGAGDAATDADVQQIRSTSVIIQRSTERELDLRDGFFLFYEWQDAPSTWSEGGSLTISEKRRFKVSNTHFDKYDLHVGDFLFRDPDSYMEPYEVTEVTKRGTDVYVITSGVDIVGSYNGLITREVLSSTVSGKDGSWQRIVRYATLGLDLTSVMPSGYATVANIPSLVRVRVKDEDYTVSIIGSDAPAGNITQVKLLGGLLLDAEPFSPSNDVEIIVFDPAVSAATASATRGGSYIKVKTFDLSGKLIETQEFN